MVYVDSNIFVYAASEPSRLSSTARKVIRIIEGGFPAATACVTIDEVVWAIKKAASYPEGVAVGKQTRKTPNLRFLDVKITDIDRAFDFMDQGFRPRDSIHLAVMANSSISTVVSEDADFDKIPEIERLSMAEFVKRFKKRR